MRLLGPAAYGQWAFAFSVVSVVLVVGHLGLDGLLVRKLVEQSKSARQLLGVTAALKYAVYIPAVFSTHAFFAFHTEIEATEQTLLYVLTVAVLVSPLTAALAAWCNANSHFKGAARGRIAAAVIGFLGKIGLITTGFGVVSIGMAHSAMFVLEAALLLLVVRFYGGPPLWQWSFDFKTARALLSQSLYLFAATIFATLYFNADVMVLRAYSSSYEVGLYALVPQVIFAFQMIPYAVTLARFPALAEAATQTRDRAVFHQAVLQVLKNLLILAALAILGLGLFILIAFDFVFGPEYSSAKPVLGLAAIALPPLFVRQLSTKVYILTDDGDRLAAIEFAALMVVLMILIVAVPQYGALAAVFAMIVGNWFSVILSLALLDRRRFWARNSTTSVS